MDGAFRRHNPAYPDHSDDVGGYPSGDEGRETDTGSGGESRSENDRKGGEEDEKDASSDDGFDRVPVEGGRRPDDVARDEYEDGANDSFCQRMSKTLVVFHAV